MSYPSPFELERQADELLRAAGIDPESPHEPPRTPAEVIRWEYASEPLRRAAEAACTERQLEALRLRFEGGTFETIAERMGLSHKSAARKLVERAHARIGSVLDLAPGMDTSGTTSRRVILEG